MHYGNWWTVALSESVNDKTPLAVVCDGEEIVLFRGSGGEACALEDRCPHRRVPLALGTVKPGGLQCGYHGWTFDGATGACTAIPNLHADERVPPRYAARAYSVAEGQGFVHVWIGAGAPSDELPSAAYLAEGREFTGTAIANIAYDEYLAVMLDGPQCLLAFEGVRITDFFLGDTRTEDGRMVLDRGAVWKAGMLPPAFVTDHPLIVRTTLPLAGGGIRVELLTADEEPVVTVYIGASANLRGTTSLCWRGYLHPRRVQAAPLRWSAARVAGRPPFRVADAIDGAAIAALLVAPSRELVAARAAYVPASLPEQRQA
ncbi:(2Fe-2S)-binding protein [Cupriavidus sp. SHE]|uniref:(2Fe-2S)-binding protein n=1 Tax=Cupriavidus metallidurans TaxID=119219 RepID=A0A482IWH2_9BURK|nr:MULTISPECIES: Rieske 2Fe-2S domain-containing protein [Cupriavidus]KWR76304.1 (2Fe-2S)-binding protein [Cupriavidus sp. SHE]QBP11807.1 (2Fe-2S)-binding protein [Cupriavidus metallidurans]